MELLYQDDRVVVCLKPQGVVSTDEPGGLPHLVLAALGDPNANVRTVHRLDQAVGGVMVLARTARAAGDLSAQMRQGQFYKEYYAVLHGTPEANCGTLTDWMLYDKSVRMARVLPESCPGAQEAVLDYEVLAHSGGMTLVRIRLHTGRTHQIRVQFASRGLPLVGDRKYGMGGESCPIALWSHAIGFSHPRTGESLFFHHAPPSCHPWTHFPEIK